MSSFPPISPIPSLPSLSPVMPSAADVTKNGAADGELLAGVLGGPVGSAAMHALGAGSGLATGAGEDLLLRGVMVVGGLVLVIVGVIQFHSTSTVVAASVKTAKKAAEIASA